MSLKLFFMAIFKFSLGVLITGLLIFLPAGSFAFINGHIFMGILFIPMFTVGIILMCKNPALLEKRLSAKEEQGQQKIVIALSGLVFIAGFLLAGFNYRFNWVKLHLWTVIAAIAVFILSYVMYGEVIRENTYLSRTVEVQKNQKVIDTGLYGIVRHPMYSATLLLFLSIPFILNSLFSFFVFLIYPAVIVIRIKNEEKVLEKGLDGYIEYEKKVKYRIIPFIW